MEEGIAGLPGEIHRKTKGPLREEGAEGSLVAALKRLCGGMCLGGMLFGGISVP